MLIDRIVQDNLRGFGFFQSYYIKKDFLLKMRLAVESLSVNKPRLNFAINFKKLDSC